MNLFNVYKQIDTQCIYYYYSIMFHTRVQVLNFSLSTASKVVKDLPANAGDTRDVGLIPGREEPLEKEMATHSGIVAGKSHGQRSLVGYSP